MPSAALSRTHQVSHTRVWRKQAAPTPSPSLRRALTSKGGTVQFIASGRNAFIYNQVSTSGSVSTWTVCRPVPRLPPHTARAHCRAVSWRLRVRQATRSGADLAADGRSASTAKQSMLQRWYKWLGAFALFLAYRAVKEIGGKQKVG